MGKRNNKTVNDVDMKLADLYRQLFRVVHQIEQNQKLRKRIATGKIKSPHPMTKEKGIKVMFKNQRPADHDLNDSLEDLRGDGIGSGNSGAGFGA